MKKYAFVTNLLIVLLELAALIHYVWRLHTLSIEFYTMDSNILALLTSLLFLFNFKKEKEWVKDLRFMTTVCLSITFLVVLTILLPLSHFDFHFLFIQNEIMIFHAIVPFLSVISYLFFEEKSHKTYLGLIATSFYGGILIILNLCDVVSGPYAFLKVKEQSILSSIFYSFLILGGSYLIGALLNIEKKKKTMVK